MPLYGALWTLQRHSKCDPIGCHNRPNNLLAMVNQDVCFAPNSVAKLFSGCRIVIIESLYQMRRIILTEIGTATNQCYAKFPWTEFCNRILPKADVPANYAE